MSGKPFWSMKVAVEDIPPAGAHFDLAADAATRAGLTRAAGLRDLPRLEAYFDVSRRGRDGLRIVGEVSALVGQNCVITLEPIENELRESVDVVFAPPAERAAAGEQDEATIRFAEDEPPEALEGGTVDLGAVATEFLLLGIDPYPRKPGAVFQPAIAGDPAARPFAGLSAWKKRKGG